MKINNFGRSVSGGGVIDGTFSLLVGAAVGNILIALRFLWDDLSNISTFKEILTNDVLLSQVIYTVFIGVYCAYLGLYYHKVWREYYFTETHGHYFIMYELYIVVMSILFYLFLSKIVLIVCVLIFLPLYWIKTKTRTSYSNAIAEYIEEKKISHIMWYEDVYHNADKDLTMEVRKFQTLEALVNSFTREFLRWGIFFFGLGAVVTHSIHWLYSEKLPVLTIKYPVNSVNTTEIVIGDVSMFGVMIILWFLIVFLFFWFKILFGVAGIRELIERKQPAAFERKVNIFK